MARLKEAFAASDENNSNGIDLKEFTRMVKMLIKEEKGKPPSDKALKAAFIDADENISGTIDWDEFTLLYARVKKGQVKGLGGGSMFKRMSPFNRKVGTTCHT